MPRPHVELSLEEIRQLEHMFAQMARAFKDHDELLINLSARAFSTPVMQRVELDEPADRLVRWALYWATEILRAEPAVKQDIVMAKRASPILLDEDKVRDAVQQLLESIRNEL